jgi:hypothetical protein
MTNRRAVPLKHFRPALRRHHGTPSNQKVNMPTEFAQQIACLLDRSPCLQDGDPGIRAVLCSRNPSRPRNCIGTPAIGPQRHGGEPGRGTGAENWMPEDRAITVHAASGQTLTFTHLVGFDEVSRCFEFTVGLAGPELDVEADALVNRPLAIEAEPNDPQRWFHGLVSEFRLVRVEERVASYEVVLRPWLWLLSLTYDCRIFQNLSVVEIMEKIFSKYPEASFEKRLQKSYQPRE